MDKVYVRVVSWGGDLELKFATSKRNKAFSPVLKDQSGTHYIYCYVEGFLTSTYYWSNDHGWEFMSLKIT